MDVLKVEVFDNGTDYSQLYFFLYGHHEYEYKIMPDTYYHFKISQDVESDSRMMFKISKDSLYSSFREIYSMTPKDYADFDDVRVFASGHNSLSEVSSFDGFGMVSNLKWSILKGDCQLKIDFINYISYQFYCCW